MKNNTRNHLLIWLFAIFCTVLNSCGARKAEKFRNSEQENSVVKQSLATEKKQEATVKIIEKTAVDDKNKIKTTETTYKPVDPTKEASVTTPDGKKHNLNNAEIFVKETEQQNNTKTDVSRNSEELNKLDQKEVKETAANTEVKKDSEIIKVEREAWSVWNLLWLLIPVGIYLIYRKYKDKIWFI